MFFCVFLAYFKLLDGSRGNVERRKKVVKCLVIEVSRDSSIGIATGWAAGCSNP
jgi:hypothetical protein